MGGPGGQVGVRGRGVRDAWRDVRGAATPVRRASRGGHELHAGRAGGGRVQTHRQGVAQRKDTIERQEREAIGGLVSFHRGHSPKDQFEVSEPGRAHQHRRLAEGRHERARDRAHAQSSRVDRQPRAGAQRESRDRHVRAVPGPADERGPAQTTQAREDPYGARPARIHSRRIAGALESRADRGAPARRFPG